MFLYFLWFIIQYTYLAVYSLDIWGGKNKRTITHRSYTYALNGDARTATIYSLHPSTHQGKIMLFISGDYNLGFHSYIRKTMQDLASHSPHIADEYYMVCFEKYDLSSIVVYDDVAMFVESLHQLVPITDLILVGYSAGGVVCSHIMSRLKHLDCTKKIITYDTPWQVRKNVECFSQNALYRPDVLFYSKVKHTYETHYDASMIGHHLVCDKWVKGANELVAMIKQIHAYSDAEMDATTGFNLDQDAGLVVVNIYCKYDPFVDRDVHNLYYDGIKDQIGFTSVFMEKPIAGHCSDMSFGREYLSYLEEAIAYRPNS